MKDPGYLPERAWHQDLNGYDLEQDSRWDEVDPGMFGTDPSLGEWPRPLRGVHRPSPVCPEDFDPAGLPEFLPLASHPREVVPAPTVRRGTNTPSTPVSPAGVLNPS